MPDRRTKGDSPIPDDVGRDAGSAGTNPEANAGGSNPRRRDDARDRDDETRRAEIDSGADEDYLNTAGSGSGGTPSAMSSTPLNTDGAVTEGLGPFGDEEAHSAGLRPGVGGGERRQADERDESERP